MRKLILMMLFTIFVIGTASAQKQKTIYYVSDYAVDLISKERIDSKAIFSFTQNTITLQWVGKQLNFRIITSKSVKEHNVIAYWVRHVGKDGKEISGLIEVVSNDAKDEYPMISYKTGDNFYFGFHTIDSYANY